MELCQCEEGWIVIDNALLYQTDIVKVIPVSICQHHVFKLRVYINTHRQSSNNLIDPYFILAHRRLGHYVKDGECDVTTAMEL